MDHFPRYTNYHLLKFTSDHSPIMLEFWDKFVCRNNHNKKKKLIRFEEIWSHDKDNFKIVQKCWANSTGNSVHKNHEVLMQLHKWGSQKFEDLSYNINQMQIKLGNLKNVIPNTAIIHQIHETEKNLSDAMLQEEVWWAQRVKTQWLKYGDNNTKFFHFKASQRRKKNTIHSICDNQGVLWHDEPHIHDIFI